jgi:hypothetical protein
MHQGFRGLRGHVPDPAAWVRAGEKCWLRGGVPSSRQPVSASQGHGSERVWNSGTVEEMMEVLGVEWIGKELGWDETHFPRVTGTGYTS